MLGLDNKQTYLPPGSEKTKTKKPLLPGLLCLFAGCLLLLFVTFAFPSATAVGEVS